MRRGVFAWDKREGKNWKLEERQEVVEIFDRRGIPRFADRERNDVVADSARFVVSWVNLRLNPHP